jgi:hypothetical protein
VERDELHSFQIRPDAGPSEITVGFERHGESLPLRADPDHLALVTFAFSHHDAGGYVRFVCFEGAGDYMRRTLL